METGLGQEKTGSLMFPCPKDMPSLEEIFRLDDGTSRNLKMKEAYGVPVPGVVPDGRVRDLGTMIGREEATRFCEAVHKKGLEFNYLLNAPYILNEEGQGVLREYIDWVVRDFKADSLTISSFDLMNFVRRLYPDVKIGVSTIAGVLSPNDMRQYLSINPKKVVVHHDANRNFDDLSLLLEEGDKRGIEIEVMATESCIRRCPKRNSHYTSISQGKSDIPFHKGCNTLKIFHPAEFLKANLIRPEDVRFYENMGVWNFKITGRSKGPGWMPEVIKAYLQRSYNGNLLRLTGIDPRLDAESLIYLDNLALKGFLEEFPKNPGDEDEYCNRWIIKLWKEGSFRVEGADYEVADNCLVCTKLPDRLKMVYGK